MADCSELAQLINDMSLNMASREDVKNIDDIVSRLRLKIPAIQRENVVDSLVLANRRPAKEISDLSKKLTEIKQEARTDKLLTRKIDELQDALGTGKLPQKVTRKIKEPTEAIAKLREIRNALQKKLRDLDKPQRDRLRLEKENERIKKQLELKISNLEKNISEGTLPETRQGIIKKRTVEIEQLRKRRNNLQQELRQSEPAVRQRLEKQISDLTKKIEEGIELPVKQPSLILSKELQGLQFERDRLRLQIRREINNLKPRSVFERFVTEPFNTARAIITSFDFSAALRQGGFIAFGRPGRAAKELPDMFRAFGSERKALQINADLLKRSNAPLYMKAKLHISPLEGVSPLSKKEEIYMSRLAEKIPGVRASERAYTTFLNKLRADSFDAMVKTLSKNGEATQGELEAIANFVNAATGRGSLGKAEQAAVQLNTGFFAPRYVASRFQLALGQPFYKGTANTRKLIAQEYARFLIGIGTVYVLADKAEFEVEFDPRSSDFGKIKIGNTRIDPLAGLSQTTVLLARLISGKTKTLSKGEIVPIRGEKVPFGGRTSFDVLSTFLRTKLSPQIGTVIDITTGKNVIGEPVTLKSTGQNLVIPLAMRDIKEAIEEQGVPEGTALGLLSIFGVGIQTFDPSKIGRMKKELKRLQEKSELTPKEKIRIQKLERNLNRMRLPKN